MKQHPKSWVQYFAWSLHWCLKIFAHFLCHHTSILLPLPTLSLPSPSHLSQIRKTLVGKEWKRHHHWSLHKQDDSAPSCRRGRARATGRNSGGEAPQINTYLNQVTCAAKRGHQLQPKVGGVRGSRGDADLCKVFRRIHEAFPTENNRLQEVRIVASVDK